jgi:phosphate:Na+ symporter
MLGTILIITFKLGGALALFMYGMQLSSDGIQRAAGERLQGAVNLMTKNRFVATFTGILVTVLLQSSSATTVMVVSFVNAGLLSLVQSIGVIMGSNIGTTLTGWIIAAVGLRKFSIIILAVPIFGVGFLMTLFKKKGAAFVSYGEALMGFALIFLGLEYLAAAIPDPSPEIIAKLSELSGPATIFLSVLAGLVFTVLINASSATLAITIGMAAKGIITFEIAAAITLGANIGTCADSFLVSLRTNANARRAAIAHLLFNVFGTLWVIAAFKPFLWFVDVVTPGKISVVSVGVHIAMLHTIFNTMNTIVLMPLTRQYARFLTWFVRERPSELSAVKRAYEAPPLVRSPELNLVQARQEIGALAALAGEMFSRYCRDLKSSPKDMEAEIERFKQWESYGDSMREGLTHYMLGVAEQDVGENTRDSIGEMLRAITELENITDTCLNLALLLQRSHGKKLKLSEDELEKLEPYTKLVRDSLSWVQEGVGGIDEEGMARALAQEEVINAARIELRKLARRRIKAGADVRTELMFIDVVRHIEKIGDFAYSASEALRGTAGRDGRRS